MDAMTLAAAFLIIAAFLIGAYAMFRISEHYNREFRRIIEDRTEKRVRDELFDLDVPEKQKRPAPRKPRPQEVKADE